MSRENQWLEDVFPIEINSPFLGDMLVFRGVDSTATLSMMYCFAIFISKLCSISIWKQFNGFALAHLG